MRAYEVFLNGKRLCVAGVGDGYVSAYITYRSEPAATWLDVVGCDSPKKRYVRWASADLHSGDEIVLKILDRRSVDKYKVTGLLNKKRDVASIKRYVRETAKGFGWEIREKPKRK
jgi:hypothetical protein